MTKTNKGMKRKLYTMIVTMVLVLSLLAGTVSDACAASGKTSNAKPKKISMSVKKAQLNVGDTKKLKVAYKPRKAATKKYVKKHAKWTSSDKKIVTVKNGKIKAVRPGKATVTVKVGKRSAKCSVTVKSPLKSISLDRANISLKPEESMDIHVIYTPKNTTDKKTVVWTSSDPETAAVSNGRVTAKRSGRTVITARVGRHTAKCTVEVKIPLCSISLNKTETNLNKGYSETLVVSYNPQDTTDDRTVTWTSSNSSIVAVSGSGRITAKKGGTATVTARVGNHTATCRVTVRIPLKSISLDNTSLIINSGNTQTLTVSYNPDDTTDDRTVTWTSNNTSVASVSGGKITAKNGGTTTITAKVGGCTATCRVTVRVPLQRITLNSNKLDIQKGYSSTLKVSYYPSNTTDSKAVTWSSSDTSVATVTGGKVYAKKNGSAVITAKVGQHTATCKVTVISRLKSISLNKKELGIIKGSTAKLSVSYDPADTTDSKAVTWTSSNTSVATVSGGVVTAKNTGSATITAKVGNHTAKCAVFVKAQSQISATGSVSKQTATVRGTKHAYPMATTYRAYLYNSSDCKSALSVRTSTGNMAFGNLNVGQTYYIKVFECRSSNGIMVNCADSVKTFKVKPTNAVYQICKTKTAADKAVYNAVKSRKASVVFYYPKKGNYDVFSKNKPLFEVWYAKIADVSSDYESTNGYGERIRINGTTYYRYKTDINYEYNKAQQSKYLSAIVSLKRKMTGSTTKKVKILNSYMRSNTSYVFKNKEKVKHRYEGYGLLVEHRGVCGGYARTAELMLKLAGVKCEYVTGDCYTTINGRKGWYEHAWNIVKVGNKWYSCDFCWDTIFKTNRYLLKGSNDKTFKKDHRLDSTYRTKSWKKAHPMATKNL